MLHLKHNQNLPTAIDCGSREANLNQINLSLIIKTEVGGKGGLAHKKNQILLALVDLLFLPRKVKQNQEFLSN